VATILVLAFADHGFCHQPCTRSPNTEGAAIVIAILVLIFTAVTYSGAVARPAAASGRKAIKQEQANTTYEDSPATVQCSSTSSSQAPLATNTDHTAGDGTVLFSLSLKQPPTHALPRPPLGNQAYTLALPWQPGLYPSLTPNPDPDPATEGRVAAGGCNTRP
jgi:hypothetical protein